MPELPEVETIRRDLARLMPGAKLISIDIRLPKMIQMPVTRLRRLIVGSKVVAVRRRAKLLLIHFSSGQTAMLHMKMSGQLIWQPTRGRLRVGGHPIPGGLVDLPNKFSHVVFYFSTGTLYFNDQRQFGYVKLIPTTKLDQWLVDQKYGPEPLESHFTLQKFTDLLDQHERKRIKPTLLDQTFIAGVGNIYADESCFAARVRPDRVIKTVTPTERRDLYHGLRAVMNLSLRHKGTTVDAYRTANGQKGGMMPFLKVYGRTGERCRRRDGGIITRVVLAGRGTHFCPICQR